MTHWIRSPRSLAWLSTSSLLCLVSLLPPAAHAALTDGIGGAVYSVAVGADGTTYVGGVLSAVGAVTGGFAAMATTDGTVNRAFPMVTGTVRAAVADGDGGWYIGGTFTVVGGQARTNLGHVDKTGAVTAWAPAATKTGLATVYALALSGTTLYAGGDFTSITPPGGSLTTRNRLAAINTSDTGSLIDWTPAADGSVNALALDGTTLYAGGSFTKITPPGGSATPRTRLAAINTSDTGSLTTWAPAADDSVNALALDGTTLYAGGDFTSINPVGGSATPRTRLAAINTSDTGSLTTWAPAADFSVNALALHGTTLYAGGGFTSITPLGGSATRARCSARPSPSASLGLQQSRAMALSLRP